MVKNFFEYVKELVPEKGSGFFIHENHNTCNALSLYQLADLIQGKKIKSNFELFNHAVGVTSYSWNVKRIFSYGFDTVGIFIEFDNGEEQWIHFSKDAFIGAICLVAIQNDVTFDDEEHETLRQAWANKDKAVVEKNQSNFNEEWFAFNLKYGHKHNHARESKRPVSFRNKA